MRLSDQYNKYVAQNYNNIELLKLDFPWEALYDTEN